MKCQSFFFNENRIASTTVPFVTVGVFRILKKKSEYIIKRHLVSEILDVYILQINSLTLLKIIMWNNVLARLGRRKTDLNKIFHTCRKPITDFWALLSQVYKIDGLSKNRDQLRLRIISKILEFDFEDALTLME